jgi:hypothetical protein
LRAHGTDDGLHHACEVAEKKSGVARSCPAEPDPAGRTVSELASGTKPSGQHEVTFDATGLPSGIYFYRLEAGDYVETKQIVVVG